MAFKNECRLVLFLHSFLQRVNLERELEVSTRAVVRARETIHTMKRKLSGATTTTTPKGEKQRRLVA